MKKGMVNIDGSRLAGQIKQRGLTFAEVSREIGYTDGFINNCIARNQINNTAVKMLNMIYHIQPEDYEYKEPVQPEPEKKEPEQTQAGIDYQMLFKVIYRAVYEAIKKAGAEE